MAIRSYVKIKPVTTKSSLGINFNEFRKGINRIGTLTTGIGKNLDETKTLIQFQREHLAESSDLIVKQDEEEKQEKESFFKRMTKMFRRKKQKKARDDAEKAAEEGKKEAEKADKKGVFKKAKEPIKNFFKLIGDIFGNLFKYFILYNALDWIEKNPEKTVKFIKLITALGKFAFWLTGIGINGIMEGLTNLVGTFDENPVARGLRFLTGAFQLIGGVAALRTAQYLIMPWKLMGDINRLKAIFSSTEEANAEVRQSNEVRNRGYRDKKTGVIYSEEEYKQMQKSAQRADDKRAKAAGKGMKSDLYQSEFENRFVTQREARRKGPLTKLGQRGRIGAKKLGRGVTKAMKPLGGIASAGLSVVGGAGRIAAGLASGESAGKAVGAGVGQAAGGIIGGIAGTALLGPFLGPFAPIVGNFIGSFLGEFIGKEIGPIVEPIFKPIQRYFGMLFDVFQSVMGPILEPIKELFGALFEFVGGIAMALFEVAKIFFEFHKFIFQTAFKAIGEVVGFVVNNAKRLMNPASVVGGIADALTFNLFNFDNDGKAAGGPVEAPPQRAAGGPTTILTPQLSIMKFMGGTMVMGLSAALGLLGIAGGPARRFIGGELGRLGQLFGVSTGGGGGGGGLGKTLGIEKMQPDQEQAAVLKDDKKKIALQEAIGDQTGLQKLLIDAIRLFDKDFGKEKNQDGGGGNSPSGGGASPSGGGASPSGPSGFTGVGGATGSANEKAVLNAIADAEGTTKYPKKGYYTQYTGKQFTGDKHPRQILGPSSLRSDAAGRYQFLSTTWDSVMGDSITPERQDKGALKLIKGRGVDISTGLTLEEIYRLGGEWASIEGGPNMVKGGGYGGQAKYSAETFLSMYEKYGGKPEMASGGMVQKRNSRLGMGEPTLENYKKLEEKVQEKKGIMGFAMGGLLATNGAVPDVKLTPETPFSDYPLHHNKPDSHSYNNNRLGGHPIVPRDYVIVRDWNDQSKDRGSPVVAGVDGKVVHASGYTVVIAKNGKDRMQFHHFDSIKATVGQVVTPSDIIGYQGNKPSGSVHVHLDATPSDHRSYAAHQLGADYDAETMSEKASTNTSDTKNNGGNNNGGGGDTEQKQETSEPMTLEQLEAKLMDAFSKFTTEFGKNITDTKLDMSGLQKAADTDPKEVEVTPPSEMVPKLEAIQQTTDAQTKAFQQAKAFGAKAERDKNMEHVIIPPKVIVRNIKQQVINNRGGGSQPVVYTSPSPMLTSN